MCTAGAHMRCNSAGCVASLAGDSKSSSSINSFPQRSQCFSRPSKGDSRSETALLSLSLDTLPNLDTLPPELIVVHVLPHLTNGEKAALAKTCSRFLRLLRHERLYYLSSQYTRKHLEDAAFREDVKARIPAGKLVLRPFECAMRAFHFPPFYFKRARTLFEQALADESATEVEKARAHLSLFLLYDLTWGGPGNIKAAGHHEDAASAGALHLLGANDEHDPVRAFERGFCFFYAMGVGRDDEEARARFAYSANGGCATGMYFFATCLRDGLAAKPDKVAAAAQYERAAALGHFGAMYEFGRCIYVAYGIPLDKQRGLELVRSAAVDEGVWTAKQWLGE